MRFAAPGTDIMQEIAGSKGFREFLGRQFEKLVGDVGMFMDAPPLAAIGLTGAMVSGTRGVYKGFQFAKQAKRLSKMEQMKQLTVPVFKSTEDAIEYGRSVIKNPIARKQLETLHKLSLEKSGALKKAGVGFDIRMEEAIKGQFFREALEEATGKFPHIAKQTKSVVGKSKKEILDMPLPSAANIEKTRELRRAALENVPPMLEVEKVMENYVKIFKSKSLSPKEIQDAKIRLEKIREGYIIGRTKYVGGVKVTGGKGKKYKEAAKILGLHEKLGTSAYLGRKVLDVMSQTKPEEEYTSLEKQLVKIGGFAEDPHPAVLGLTALATLAKAWGHYKKGGLFDVLREQGLFKIPQKKDEGLFTIPIAARRATRR